MNKKGQFVFLLVFLFLFLSACGVVATERQKMAELCLSGNQLACNYHEALLVEDAARQILDSAESDSKEAKAAFEAGEADKVASQKTATAIAQSTAQPTATLAVVPTETEVGFIPTDANWGESDMVHPNSMTSTPTLTPIPDGQ